MPDPYARTTYGQGSINTETLGMPTGLGGGGASNQLDALMRMKLRQMNQPQPIQTIRTVTPSGGPALNTGQEQNVGPITPEMRGMVKSYVKPATMFNSMGGYMRASAGDPGAAFSGYIDPRSLPQHAGISPVGLQEDALRQQQGAADFARFANESVARQRIGSGRY